MYTFFVTNELNIIYINPSQFKMKNINIEKGTDKVLAPY